jgi:predicted GNAT family acetyltransferase
VTQTPKAVVREDPDNHRYVLELDGEVVGLAVYHLRGGRYIFVHTEIQPGHGGEGLGSTLARRALDDVRAKGAKIVPLCPFISAFIRRHPEYEDMIDQRLLEAIDHGG